MSRAGQAGRTKACDGLQGRALEQNFGKYKGKASGNLMTVWRNGQWKGQGRSRQTVRVEGPKASDGDKVDLRYVCEPNGTELVDLRNWV